MARTPKYRRHPNGQAFVQYKNKRYYLGKYDTPESRRKYEEFLSRIESGDAPLFGNASIADAVRSYTAQAEAELGGNLSATARGAALLEALDLLRLHYGDHAPSQFGPLKLIKLQRLLSEVRYPVARADRQIREIKRFFRWCVAKELISFTLYFGLLCVEPIRQTGPRSDPIAERGLVN